MLRPVPTVLSPLLLPILHAGETQPRTSLVFSGTQAEDSVSCQGLGLWYPEVSGLEREGGGTFGRECCTLAGRVLLREGRAGQSMPRGGVLDRGIFFTLVLGPYQVRTAVVQAWLQVA